MSTIEVTMDFGGLEDQELTVEYDWYGGWKGSWDGGMQMEPNEPAGATINSVLWEGCEVAYLLEENEYLLTKCAEDHHGKRDAYEESRAEAAMEDRKGL